MSVTPNMGLLIPVPLSTLGPTYASEIDDAFGLVDSHDHTAGKGVPVPTAGLNINADLLFNSFNASALRSTQFTSQSAPLSLPSDVNMLYVVSGNLFYNNNLGQPVQITSGAALDATSIGGIGGDYATSTALEFYTSATKTFTFWSNTDTPASLDSGPVTIRNNTLNSFGITLEVPPDISSNSTIILTPGSFVPPGAMFDYGGATAPSGYLICDGSAISRATFSNLFTAIGTNFGVGDGSTTFNLPPSGVFYRSVSGTSGNDPDASSRTAINGGNSGNNVGSFQLSDFLAHSHTRDPAGNNEKYQFGTGLGDFASGGMLAAAFAVNTGNTAGGGPGNETRGINVYITKIIKI